MLGWTGCAWCLPLCLRVLFCGADRTSQHRGSVCRMTVWSHLCLLPSAVQRSVGARHVGK